MSPPGVRRSVLLVLSSALSGCGDAALERCIALTEKGSYQDAASHCGTVYHETGNGHAALHAARALNELGDVESLLRWEERLRGSADEAALLELTADYFVRAEDNQEASDRFRRVIELSEASSDHAAVSRAHYELFYLAWQSSSYREALSHAALSFEASRRAQDQDLESRALQALFTVLYETGDLDSALESLRRAQEIAPEDPYDLAAIWLNRSAVLIDQGRFHLARDAITRALERESSIEGTMFLRSAYLNLVTVHLALGDVRAAEESLAKASLFVEPGRRYVSVLYHRAQVEAELGRLREARSLLTEAMELEPIPEWSWQLETELGRVAEGLGEIESAERAYENATRTIEEMRASLALDDMKSWLLQQKREPYEALFRMRAEQDRALEALAILERAKARAFLDAFVEATLPPPAEPSIPAFAPLQRFEALERLLPAMGSSTVTAVRDIEEILKKLGRAYVLVYFVAEGRLWLADVSGGKVRIRPLAAANEVRRIVSDFVARTDDRELALRLSEILLPDDALPPRGARLHIVTDDALGKVPLSALQARHRFLAEEYVVSFVPSLNATAILMNPRERGSEAPVVLAASERDLPGAAAEALAVASRLGVPPGIGPGATRSRVVGASRASLLHLALHTGIDHRGPWMRLSDGSLSADVILKERVSPGVVVLATCASAARRGSDLWGSLAAAFLAAGSHSVVASLWSIEDDAAREFVEAFYAKGGAQDAALALARTQRDFIAEGKPPSFWSPFVHLGPAEPLP